MVAVQAAGALLEGDERVASDPFQAAVFANWSANSQEIDRARLPPTVRPL